MVQGEDADWVSIAWVYIGLCSLAQSEKSVMPSVKGGSYC